MNVFANQQLMKFELIFKKSPTKAVCFSSWQRDSLSWTGFEACAVPNLTVVLVCYQPHRTKLRDSSRKR